MSDRVVAIVVRHREHLNGAVTEDRYTDARYASVDSLGHLHLYTEAAGSPRRIVGVIAAGVWLSWRIDTGTCPGTCPPLATVTSLPAPTIAEFQPRVV